MKTTSWEVSVEWNVDELRFLSCHIRVYCLTIGLKLPNTLTTHASSATTMSQKIGEIWGLVSNGLFQNDDEAAKWDQKAINSGH